MDTVNNQPKTTLVDGLEIELRGEKLVLPPCPLARMKNANVIFAGSTNATEPEYVDALIEVIHVSLLRNYPDMDKAFVEDNLDMANMGGILNQFMLVNKLKQKEAGAELGETQAL